jgi:ABC-type sugar transport system ATPase subunit
VADGEFLVVVGPSGSGKSTLLRVVAGLEPLTAGSVWIGGRQADRLPPHARGVAMVFQAPALYPHLTVGENLAFGLRRRRLPPNEAAARLLAVAGRLGLLEVLDRRPKALSGGQRQRVALGRAVASKADVLLLDEPLSSLDAPLRAATRADLIDLHQTDRPTMILVTHDQGEAMALGDRIAVMAEGRLEQVGAPGEVYRRPATRFVAEFIGTPPMNVLDVEASFKADTAQIRLNDLEPGARFDVPANVPWLKPVRQRGDGPVALGLRAEHIHCGAGPSQGGNASLFPLATTVGRLEPLGHETIATLDAGEDLRIRVRLPGTSAVRLKDPLAVRLDLSQALWFDPETGALLS